MELILSNEGNGPPSSKTKVIYLSRRLRTSYPNLNIFKLNVSRKILVYRICRFGDETDGPEDYKIKYPKEIREGRIRVELGTTGLRRRRWDPWTGGLDSQTNLSRQR